MLVHSCDTQLPAMLMQIPCPCLACWHGTLPDDGVDKVVAHAACHAVKNPKICYDVSRLFQLGCLSDHRSYLSCIPRLEIDNTQFSMSVGADLQPRCSDLVAASKASFRARAGTEGNAIKEYVIRQAYPASLLIAATLVSLTRAWPQQRYLAVEPRHL